MTNPNMQPDPDRGEDTKRTYDASLTAGRAAVQASFSRGHDTPSLPVATSDEAFHGAVTVLSGHDQLPFTD
jgi:hypothetical protein